MKAFRTLSLLSAITTATGAQAASLGDIRIYMDWSTMSITGATMTPTTFTDPQSGQTFSSDGDGFVANQDGGLGGASGVDGESAIASYNDTIFNLKGGYDATGNLVPVADASGGLVSVTNNEFGVKSGDAGGWHGFFYQAEGTGQVTIAVDYFVDASVSTELFDDISIGGYEVFMDAVDADLWSSTYAAAITSGSTAKEAELAAEAASTLDEYFFNDWNLLSCAGVLCSDSISTSGMVSVTFDVTSGTTYAFGADAGAGVYTESFSAVPVPAAVWLFGSGLLGLVGIARRKKA